MTPDAPRVAARLFAIVGPSGAGKDTLIFGALAARSDLRLVRRVIIRAEAAGGEDFESVTEIEFPSRKAQGAFALDWQAHGLRYGIPANQVTGRAGAILFNGSRAALPRARQVFPGLGVNVITAPDAVLADRLAARGRESADDIATRLSCAAFTLPAGLGPVTVVQNDATLEVGIARLLAALQPVSANLCNK